MTRVGSTHVLPADEGHCWSGVSWHGPCVTDAGRPSRTYLPVNRSRNEAPSPRAVNGSRSAVEGKGRHLDDGTGGELPRAALVPGTACSSREERNVPLVSPAAPCAPARNGSVGPRGASRAAASERGSEPPGHGSGSAAADGLLTTASRVPARGSDVQLPRAPSRTRPVEEPHPSEAVRQASSATCGSWAPSRARQLGHKVRSCNVLL